MGPIRTFSRPSLAAGEFVASATPYSHTQGFSTSHRPCSAHDTTSLGPQHSVLSHPHLYSSVCAAGPLHAGLVSSPAAPSPCFFHFRKLLPPGAVPPDTHLAVGAQQDTRGASQGVTRDAVVHESRKKDIFEHGWKNGGEYEWKNKDERKSKKKSTENILKKHKQERKWRQHNGSHKRRAKKSEYKWERFGDAQLWVRNEDENKRKKKKDKLKWNKGHRDTQRIRSEEEHEASNERRKEKWSKNEPTSPDITTPGSRDDDPCTSRMPLGFPFSDEDEDDDYGHGGRDNKEGNAESWPISDIVETEDEEAENQSGHVQDTAGDERDSLPALSDIAGTAVVEAECAADDVKVILRQHGRSEVEDASSDLRAALEWQDSPSSGEKRELHNDSDVDDENNSEEQMEHDEGKRRSGEDDYPRDSVRATQRLRPRSYRQFLLTRERRSRVFLKERSYHLGRWFVTHFTHPYPSKEQKDHLASFTNMTRNQVSEWFGNMRRRIKEATRGLGVCWNEQVRLYNSVITGKSEPLPIQPGDAINTWIPPVAEEPPPKFKKTLMQRYLNNSSETLPHHVSGDPRPSPTPTPSTSQEEDLNLPKGHHKSSEYPKSRAVTSHVLPLCTSSPKESVQARWNTSFQHVKVNKFPSVTTRLLDKTEVRMKPFGGGRGQGEEEGRLIRKYERHRTRDYSSANSKRQKTNRDPFQSSSPCCSSSLPLDPRKAAGEGWRTLASTSTAQFQPSAWMVPRPFVDVRSSDEEGRAGCCTRKPEELDAAYTLMELHTDTTSAHFMASPPCLPSLSF